MGALYLFLVFLCCFLLVHIGRLIYLGFLSIRTQKTTKPAEKKEEEKPTQKVEPIYYIVEKKRAKRKYSEPKEIKFKNQNE